MKITLYNAVRNIVGLTDAEFERALPAGFKVDDKVITGRDSTIDVKLGVQIEGRGYKVTVVQPHLDHLSRLMGILPYRS